MKLPNNFFARDPVAVAKDLLGKVIRVKHGNLWLAACIIETEAYYINDRASHASLGYTLKRRALFMPPGTIYMYYSRAGDSLNVSCLGEGNAVLIKAAYPYLQGLTAKKAQQMLDVMRHQLANENWYKTKKLVTNDVNKLRTIEKLCCGQTLLCRALGLKVKDWDQKKFSRQKFYIDDVGYHPQDIIQTTRLGIRAGRDEHLPYRFIDLAWARYCTKRPSPSIP